jgi:hypothetical protein
MTQGELGATQEELQTVKGERQSTQEELQTTKEERQSTQEAKAAAQVQVAGLQKVKTPPPAFVKANKKKPQAQEKKPRKKREAQYNRARKRSVPTQIVEQRIVACPDCHLRLGGISLARCREIIDVPPPPAVQVTEHRIYKGWCTQCHKWHEAAVDFSKQVLGQGRIGVRLASLIAYLRTVMRLPVRQLRDVLQTLHGFLRQCGRTGGTLASVKASMPSPSLRVSRQKSVPARPSRLMRADGEKMGSTDISGVSAHRRCVMMNIITPEPEKWSNN